MKPATNRSGREYIPVQSQQNSRSEKDNAALSREDIGTERFEFGADALAFYLYPGGNDTYLVYDPGLRRHDYPAADRELRSLYSKLEQGGFLEPAETTGALVRLQMAGGEFCGNALRSCAALIVNDFLGDKRLSEIIDYSRLERRGNVFKFNLESSGVAETIEVNVAVRQGEVYSEARVPLPSREGLISPASLNTGSQMIPVQVVRLKGITHILIDESEFSFKPDEGWYSSLMAEAVASLDLRDEEAVGLIWFNKDQSGELSINPVVWVKNVNTCFYETSCGSGSLATALLEGYSGSKDFEASRTFSIRQPGGALIEIGFEGKEESTVGTTEVATMGGLVEVRGELSLNQRVNRTRPLVFSLRQVSAENDSSRAGFVSVYQRAFSGPPYFESFPSDIVEKQVWSAHLCENQPIFIAEARGAGSGKETAGLACAFSLKSAVEPVLAQYVKSLIRDKNLVEPDDDVFFISELAVDEAYRGMGLGRGLTESLLSWGKANGFKHWATRTAGSGSNSLNIFLSLGARIIGRANVEDEVVVSTNSKERVYLLGEVK